LPLLLLLSCHLFFFLRGRNRSCRLFFFLRGLTRFSLPRLCRPLCAGCGFSYPRPLRFPLLACSLYRPLRLCRLSTFALNSWFRSLLRWCALLQPLLASNASRRAAGFLDRLTGPDASLTCYSLRGSRSAPLSRSSGFARGRCTALLSDPFSWFFGLTTLCLWRSCQTLCWISRTGARPPRYSWLTS
jgi:hypothetical protein